MRTLLLACLLAAGSHVVLAQSPDGPVRISGGVMAGQILSKVAPVYPPDARAAYVSGSVVLRAIIGKDGIIRNLTVISGPQMLHQSAIDAVSQWTYRPFILNGEPVEVDTTITVNYNIAPSAPPSMHPDNL